MKIQIQKTETHLIAEVAGPRIDSLRTLSFKEALRPIAQNTNQSIVLDLSNVDFMDSSGLGALVAIGQLVPDPYRMVFANPQPHVARVLQLTHLDRIFEIVPDAHKPLPDAA